MNRLTVLAAALIVVAGACSSGSSAPETETTSGSEVTTTTTEAPSPETTDAAETTTTVPDTSGVGTLDNPVPAGDFANVADWNIRIIDANPDALDAIREYDDTADAPEAGNQYFMITLEAEYTGTESGTFWADLTWKAVGPSAVAYEEGSSTCGFIPDNVSDIPEAFPGGVSTGNVCWSVSEEDAADMMLILEPFFGLDDTRVAFDADPDMAPVDPLPVASADLSTLPAIELGEFAQVGDWNVRVVDVVPDATSIVLDENEYAEPPADGRQFVMATLEAEYTGSESGSFWSDLTWKVLGPSALALTESDADCGTIPDAMYDFGEVFPEGSVEGNVCWSVLTSDVDELVMLLEEFSMDESGRTFFTLTAGG